MNADHADAVRLYATKLLGAEDGPWRLTGLDPEGLDLALDDATLRLPFPRRVATAEAAAQGGGGFGCRGAEQIGERRRAAVRWRQRTRFVALQRGNTGDIQSVSACDGNRSWQGLRRLDIGSLSIRERIRWRSGCRQQAAEWVAEASVKETGLRNSAHGADKFGLKDLAAVHWNLPDAVLTETRDRRRRRPAGPGRRVLRRDRSPHRPQPEGQIRRRRRADRKNRLVGKERPADAGKIPAAVR